MAVIVYPGSFDPITNGHVDLVRRAACLFDGIIIAVAQAHHKKTLFSHDERLALTTKTFHQESKIKVLPLQGLLIDFVKQHKADAVLRGLRTAADFEYEFQLAGMNRSMDATFETIFMMPSQETLFISSTLVREVITLKGDVSRFVPAAVAEYIDHGA